MPYTIKPGSFKYKKSNGQFSEIDCFEGPDLTEEVAALEKGKAPIIIDSATGNPIVIKDGADGLPVEGMKIHFSPIQSGTGDPSPSNIRLISGWNRINTWRTGKNLIRAKYSGRKDGGITYTVDENGIITANGTTSADSWAAPNLTNYPELMTLIQPGTYRLTGGVSDNERVYLGGRYVDGDVFTGSADTGNGVTYVFTKPIYVYPQVMIRSGTTTNATFRIQFELSSTATPYTTCTGQSYPIILPALGKNLLNPANSNSLYYGESNEYTLTNGVLVSIEGGSVLMGFKVKCKPNTRYTFTFTTTNDINMRVYGYSEEPAMYTIGNQLVNLNDHDEATFLTGETDEWLICGIYIARDKPITTVSNFQLEIGDTATTYEPFNTIYGGTLDAVNGVLTVEWEAFSAKLSDATIKTEYDGINMYRFDNVFAHNVLNNLNQKCDIVGYEFGTEAVLTNHFYVFNKTIRLYMLTPVDETKEFTIVCPIAEPYEIQLDPVTITTLLGDNTIWSDANGTIELDYRADTKLFCQKNDQVNDVQINGTSILNAQGVANVPFADNSGVAGVAKYETWRGVAINVNGYAYLNNATSGLVKNGSDAYRPIAPSLQHESVFYGLAKLAGADMASSSNPVGQFTDDALVKIQKMLGVYQAPWELIREDSFTNDLTTASDHIITVDSNGQPFELTDALMLFELPQNENTAEKGYYGQIWFYYDTDSVIAPEPGSASRAANGVSQGAWYMINYSNKIVTTQSTVFTTNTNSTYWRARYIQYMNGAANSNMGIFVANDFAITKINIRQVKGEGHYKLYGRRKWAT